MAHAHVLEVKGVNGHVVFDGRTVSIHRKGVLARTTVGKGTKSIPVAAITAVQWKPAGMVRGYIQFTVPGGNERRASFGKQTVDAAQDENSVLFGRTQQPAFEALRAAVQAAITASHQGGAANTAVPPVTSTADELAKLAELHGLGLLTQAEFNAAKARLLGGSPPSAAPPPATPPAAAADGGQVVPLPGGYQVEVAGESYHQAELEQLCGGRSSEGAYLTCVAELVPEPDNPYDANAVAVRVSGLQVGHLPRQVAQSFVPISQRLLELGITASCAALVTGGWDRGGRDTGHFGVKLDLAAPQDCLNRLG